MRKYLRFINFCIAGTFILSVLTVCACAPKTKLSSITIASAKPEIFQLGTTQQFTATGIYSDKSTRNITADVKWKSSNSTVATISETGLVTAANLGSTQITATLSGITSAATTLPVVTIKAVNIEQKSPLKLLVKGTQQFTALATFSDNSQEDCTLLSKWTSSLPSVAVISAIGSATGNWPAAQTSPHRYTG